MPADADGHKAHGKRGYGLKIVQLLVCADQAEAGRADHYAAEYIACHVGQFKEFTDPPTGKACENDNAYDQKGTQVFGVKNRIENLS
jgi:hypothetical protein